jgi:NADP-dependent 3-hydroxy acid dehydrogenase YdfG
MKMHGKTIVITGASAGIGEELAVAMAARGAKVVLAARDVAALERVASRCTSAGGRALVAPTDVSDPAQCKALVQKTIAEFGALDVLVNNAGISMWARFDEVTDLTIFERTKRAHIEMPALFTSTSIVAAAIEKRKREVVMTPRAKLGLFVKLVAPQIVDRMAMRAVREK